MKRYELWRSADGKRDSFFETGSETAYGWLEPGSTLVWTVEARSYHEAQRKRAVFMNRGDCRTAEK